MKKHLAIVLMLVLAFPLAAQHKQQSREQHKQPEISEIVKDLSAPQKRKIENITLQSRQRVEELRASKRAVGDSIASLMQQDGDQSQQLFPLFDREAALQTAINREMYSTKLRIDEVLTREQRAVLRQSAHKGKSIRSGNPPHPKH